MITEEQFKIICRSVFPSCRFESYFCKVMLGMYIEHDMYATYDRHHNTVYVYNDYDCFFTEEVKSEQELTDYLKTLKN